MKFLKKKSCSIFYILLVIMPFSLNALTAVTYTFSGGRFGDNLLAYVHAKWISYKYEIPLLYKPFNYSDQLNMHRYEIHYYQTMEQHFKKIVTYSEAHGIIDPESDYLYVIPFFPESIFNRNDKDCPYLFNVDWTHPEFKKLLQECISPLNSLKMFELPDGYMHVALHVRKGTGWDIPVYKINSEQLTASHPLRFAPDSFFIEQLKKIAQLYHDQKIYVYLFTDHNNPGELAQEYSQAVKCNRMFFDYRMAENNEFINVIEDFFALTYFDCLIRADSNFSFVASKLGNYKMVISPWHGLVIGTETIIDEIEIEHNGISLIQKENSD